MEKHKLSLFIFRRDLRLDDNTALLKALESSQAVIPVFIFDSRQLNKNPYRGDFLIQFMLESLEDLNDQLKTRGGRLFFLQGSAHEVVRQLLKDHPIDAVYINRDYTTFAVQRDLAIQHECVSRKVDFHSLGDALLHEPEDIHKDDGSVYTVYTPFYKKAMTRAVRKPVVNNHRHYERSLLKNSDHFDFTRILNQRIKDPLIPGGRSHAVKILRDIKKYKNYANERDIPSLTGTTRLSAHHKFGTVSAREVYWAVEKAFGADHTLIKELFWRDFFTHVGFHHPFVLGEAFQERYRKIKWINDDKKFQAWCEGKTGFPIVDAGMRELNATGWMHNRVRMITASFLVKDLHIDWRWGEKYFAQKLVDYDPYVNNGNWQWAASTGCDAQPYFRIFNPWLQQQKFDPDARYIKQWIPELRNISTDMIHSLDQAPLFGVKDYPRPIVDHKAASEYAKTMFKI